MRKIVKNVITALLAIITTNLYSQSSFLGTNLSYEIDGNNLTLFSVTSFAFGSANVTCPRLDTAIISEYNDIISVDLHFDARGVWPQYGCTTYDTTTTLIDTNFHVILVNTNVINDGISINDSIINTVQSDTLVQNTFSITDTYLDNQINIYPNPSNGILQLDVLGDIEFERIDLFEMGGKTVQTYNCSDRTFDISGLSSGSYVLKLKTNKGILTEKIIVE